MTNLYFFHLHAGYSIFQNFFCAGIQFFIVLNSYKKSKNRKSPCILWYSFSYRYGNSSGDNVIVAYSDKRKFIYECFVLLSDYVNRNTSMLVCIQAEVDRS